MKFENKNVNTCIFQSTMFIQELVDIHLREREREFSIQNK